MWYIFEKRALWNVHLDGKLVAKFATEEEAKKYTGWAIPAEETTDASKEETKDSKEERLTTKESKSIRL